MKVATPAVQGARPALNQSPVLPSVPQEWGWHSQQMEAAEMCLLATLLRAPEYHENVTNESSQQLATPALRLRHGHLVCRIAAHLITTNTTRLKATGM